MPCSTSTGSRLLSARSSVATTPMRTCRPVTWLFSACCLIPWRIYSEPIPGVVDTVEALRKAGIKIGSTTGYTDKMMDIVIPAAEKAGYKVDNCVTSDHLPAGRPYPYMVYRNMIDLAVPSVDCVLKYGDTIADIKEGVNAKVWTVGVVMGSNELALTQEEVAAMSAGELDARKAEVRRRMLEAGAHYVVDDITELPAIIETINQKMNQ